MQTRLLYILYPACALQSLVLCSQGLKYPLNIAVLNRPIERDISGKWTSTNGNFNSIFAWLIKVIFISIIIISLFNLQRNWKWILNDLCCFCHVTMILFSSIFIDDSRWLSYCEVRGDVSHRFDSKWTHFQWKEAAGYEYVSTTEQHMRLFEAACRVSLKHLTDEILSGKNLSHFLCCCNSSRSHVSWGRGRSVILFFCHLLARTRGMLIQKPDESWNFNLQ